MPPIANRKDRYKERHSLPTVAGIEDCLAVMIDALNEVETSRIYLEARLMELFEKLQKLRIEDCLHILLDILQEIENSRGYIEARLMEIYQILKTLRAGPYAYDPEKAAGRRDKINVTNGNKSTTWSNVQKPWNQVEDRRSPDEPDP